MRSDEFVARRLEQIWQLLFPEVEKKNNLVVRFKGRWKNKFGHIKLLKNKDTEIAVNSLLKDPKTPEYIIDITLAHELVHYMHGFNSPLPKKFKHPHKNGVVTRELIKRGFSKMLREEKAFLKNEWPEIVKLNFK